MSKNYQELLAFTAEHVSRLTGLSVRQLKYWDATGFFAPRVIAARRGAPFGHIYSFRDVVGLRALAVLRKEHRIPLQELRKVGEELSKLHDTPWSAFRLYVAGKTVAFEDPRTGRPVAARPFGQVIFPVDLEVIASDMRSAAARLRERDPNQIGRFERHRYVVHNANVVAGTRIPTEAVWNLSKAGYGEAEIIREYPRLTKKDVRAALEFEQVRRDRRAG